MFKPIYPGVCLVKLYRFTTCVLSVHFPYFSWFFDRFSPKYLLSLAIQLSKKTTFPSKTPVISLIWDPKKLFRFGWWFSNGHIKQEIYKIGHISENESDLHNSLFHASRIHVRSYLTQRHNATAVNHMVYFDFSSHL